MCFRVYRGNGRHGRYLEVARSHVTSCYICLSRCYLFKLRLGSEFCSFYATVLTRSLNEEHPRVVFHQVDAFHHCSLMHPAPRNTGYTYPASAQRQRRSPTTGACCWRRQKFSHSVGMTDDHVEVGGVPLPRYISDQVASGEPRNEVFAPNVSRRRVGCSHARITH